MFASFNSVLLYRELIIFFSQALSQVRTEIKKLKENIHRLEEIDESRAELNNLEMELQWAKVSKSSKNVLGTCLQK